MRISNASKAIFILANYVTANLVPPHLKINIRLNRGAGEDGTSYGVDFVDDSTSVNPSVAKIPEGLLPRQQSCDRCRTRCPTGKIIHPTKCRRCIRCPPGKKADPTSRICVDGNPEPDQEDKDKRKQDREKSYQGKKKDEKDNFRIRKYDTKKEKEKEKYRINEEHKRDNERRKKVRRAGRCLPVVALAMGAGVASEFADEFFDEAYLESMDLEQFWPEDLPIEPWDSEDSDHIFEEDEYIDQWINVGNSQGSATVSGIVRRTRDDANTDVGNGDVVNLTEVQTEIRTRQPGAIQLVSCSDATVKGQLDTRFLPFLIPIFAAVAGTAARVGAAAGKAAGSVLKLTRYTVKIGTGKSSKKSFKEQSDGARRISQNKNWRTCLTKGTPSA
ncbi:hypothetical protein V8F06_013734 [Rhypophila decipiens]